MHEVRCKYKGVEFSYSPVYNIVSILSVDKEKFDGTVEFPSEIDGKRPEIINYGFSSGVRNQIKEIIVPEGYKEIYSSAFAGYANLEKISLPGSLTSIGKKAFHSCRKLKEIDIPDNVVKIGENALYGCSSLDKIRIGKNADFISVITSMNGEKHIDVEISPESEKMDFVDGCIVNKEQQMIVECINPDKIPDREDIKRIGDAAFAGVHFKKTPVMPDNITYIRMYAFNKATGIGNMNMSKNLYYISDCAFADSDIKNVKFPPSLENIGVGAFHRCDELESADIGECDKITFIRELAFCGCHGLKDVKLPPKLLCIGASAFQSTAVRNIDIPETCNDIQSEAFAYCRNLKSVDMSKMNMEVISACAFRNCPSLERVRLPENLTIIGVSAFEECSSLKYVKLPDSVVQICPSAFQNADLSGKTGEFNFPDSVRNVHKDAFAKCRFNKVNLPFAPSYISRFAFEGCHSITFVAREGCEKLDIDFLKGVKRAVALDLRGAPDIFLQYRNPDPTFKNRDVKWLFALNPGDTFFWEPCDKRGESKGGYFCGTEKTGAAIEKQYKILYEAKTPKRVAVDDAIHDAYKTAAEIKDVSKPSGRDDKTR